MVGSGPSKVATLIDIVRDDTDARLPSAARFALSTIADQIEELACQITKLETAIIAEAKEEAEMSAPNHDSGCWSHHCGIDQSAGARSRGV